jgi:hypothetical protein
MDAIFKTKNWIIFRCIHFVYFNLNLSSFGNIDILTYIRTCRFLFKGKNKNIDISVL